MPVTPIFLFAISRTGSTLVQRILAAHPDVASHSEPFFLLPLLRPLQRQPLGAAGEWHHLEHRGLVELTGNLADGVSVYERAARGLTLELYEQAAADKRYFLDKTPQYYAVIEEIIRVFPEAKFVFLWRNPLAVIASCIDTWAGGRWRIERYRRDWFDGLPRLIESYRRHRAISFAIRYEDVCAGDPKQLQRLFEYLGLEWDPTVIGRFAEVDLGGSLGDPTGVARYGSLSQAPLEKWRHTLSSPVRRWWCQRYLEWLGEDRLATMGYDLNGLVRDLRAGRPDPGTALQDAAYLAFLAGREVFTRHTRQAAPASWRRLMSERPRAAHD